MRSLAMASRRWRLKLHHQVFHRQAPLSSPFTSTTICPADIMTSRLPCWMASRMLCVTIMVVRLRSAMKRSVSSSTLRAVLGSSAGVLVQQQQARGFQDSHQQRRRLALAAGQQPHLGAHAAFQPQLQRGQHVAEGLPFGAVDAPAQRAALPAAHGQRQVFLNGHVGGVPIMGS